MEKSNEPLITIIVGMYNGEKYICECIESIIHQDYENLEILLVDDGSPDNCGKIADEYAKKDRRIKVIHQNNSGVSISRNNAIDVSKGEYLCIIDQDDIISEDYISYFYNLIKENEADISLTPNVDKFLKKVNRNCNIKDKTEIWTPERAVIEMLYHKIVIAPWNKMIKRTIITSNNIKFNSNFFNGEGFAFSIECFQNASKIAVGKKLVYHYRVGDPDSGASKFKVEYIKSSLNAQEYIKDTLKFKNRAVNEAWEFSNWHTHCDAFNIIVGCNAIDKNKELYDSIKHKCQKDAMCVLNAPISFQQKLRGILFKLNPNIAAKIINKFRIRKFKKES